MIDIALLDKRIALPDLTTAEGVKVPGGNLCAIGSLNITDGSNVNL